MVSSGASRALKASLTKLFQRAVKILACVGLFGDVPVWHKTVLLPSTYKPCIDCFPVCPKFSAVFLIAAHAAVPLSGVIGWAAKIARPISSGIWGTTALPQAFILRLSIARGTPSPVRKGSEPDTTGRPRSTLP